MEKIVKTLLLSAIFAISVFGNTLLDNIKRDASALSVSKKDKTVRIYHDLKNLYIKSIINDDKVSQIEVLKALIKSSRILNLPYSHYSKELTLLTKNNHIVSKKPKKSLVAKKHSYARVRSIKSSKNRVDIRFNNKIDRKDISFYELNSKNRYRDIYDIKAKLMFKVQPIKLRGIKSVRISQYKKNRVRIVLESSSPIKSTFSIENYNVAIKVFDKNKQNSKKRSSYNATDKTYVGKYFTFKADKKIVVLDPGHGGKDTGAIGYKRLREKDAVLKIAKKVGKYLTKYGYKVYYTRKRDIFIKLRNRTHFANLKKADIFISIHANAAPKKKQYLSSKGVETYFLSPARSARAKRVSAIENSVDINNMSYYSKQVFLNFLNRQKIISSNKLAIDVQRGILKNVRKKYRVVDGGVRKAPFWVLVGAQMPAILIETGFITNPTEARRLFNPYYEDLLAKGIADGVISYFEKNR